MIRGYHVYKEIWEAAVGEELQCARETDNVMIFLQSSGQKKTVLLLKGALGGSEDYLCVLGNATKP